MKGRKPKMDLVNARDVAWTFLDNIPADVQRSQGQLNLTTLTPTSGAGLLSKGTRVPKNSGTFTMETGNGQSFTLYIKEN